VKRVREARTAYATEPVQAAYPPQGEWTYEDYIHLPDDGWKYEVIEGVLYMTPSPNTKHQRAIVRILLTMGTFVRQKKLGELFASPLDVILPNNLGTPVQPDIFFIRQERLGIVKEGNIEGAPDLVVEVLSPSNWLDDRRVKFKAYSQATIPEYWIVDPIQDTIEVFVLDDTQSYVLLDRFDLGDIVHSEVIAGFNMPVKDVFSE
jgi:Uma2 family endonuclease